MISRVAGGNTGARGATRHGPVRRRGAHSTGVAARRDAQAAVDHADRSTGVISGRAIHAAGERSAATGGRTIGRHGAGSASGGSSRCAARRETGVESAYVAAAVIAGIACNAAGAARTGCYAIPSGRCRASGGRRARHTGTSSAARCAGRARCARRAAGPGCAAGYSAGSDATSGRVAG